MVRRLSRCRQVGASYPWFFIHKDFISLLDHNATLREYFNVSSTMAKQQSVLDTSQSKHVTHRTAWRLVRLSFGTSSVRPQEGIRLRRVFRESLDLQLHSLAPSPRILAYLARQASKLQPYNMAVATVEPLQIPREEPDVFMPPPNIITTPCDPWPRPYHLEDGLRKVYPYHFTYNTYCKQRWRGREILDIFATEFRDRPQEYYVRSDLVSPVR